MLLYLSVVSTALLGLLASAAVPTATWGRLVDLAAGIAIFVVMWLWVRANRVALDCADHLARAKSTMPRTIRSRRPVSIGRAGIDPPRDFEPSPTVMRLRPNDTVVPRCDDDRWPRTSGDPKSR